LAPEATVNGSTANPSGFKAFGKIYANEREAILEFLDKYGAAEAAAEVCLNKWVDLAKNDCVRGGKRAKSGSHGKSVASDPNLSDAEKLLKATSFGPDPKALLQPIFDFGDAI
jgi:hypothetical protein